MVCVYVCVDTTGYSLTLWEPCSPHCWLLLFTLHFSPWDWAKSRVSMSSVWYHRLTHFNLKKEEGIPFHIFLGLHIKSDIFDIPPKACNPVKHFVLTLSDALPLKSVTELANCSTKSIFRLSAAVFPYQPRSHSGRDLWFLLSAGGRCIMPLSRSTHSFTGAEKVRPLVDRETDLPRLSINKWWLHSHIGPSNRAPSGQAKLHNSWTGYPRVRARTIRRRSWNQMQTPKGFLTGKIALQVWNELWLFFITHFTIQ